MAIGIYTHVSAQYAVFSTKVISCSLHSAGSSTEKIIFLTSRTEEAQNVPLDIDNVGPMPPAGLGLAIGGASIAAYTAAAAASGRSGTLLAGGPESQLFRGVITILALLAYVPTAQVYLARWTRDHVESLRPLLRAPGPPPPSFIRRFALRFGGARVQRGSGPQREAKRPR